MSTETESTSPKTQICIVSLGDAAETICKACQSDSLEFEHFNGNIEEQQHQDFLAGFDVVVTAGNSYGEMSGGIDLAFLNIYGKWLESAIKMRISENYGRHLPVGSTVSVRAKGDQILVYAPTMSVPMKLGDETLAPYIATAGALREIMRLSQCFPINRILIPAMGLGTGQVPVDIIAKQMAAAFAEIHIFKQSWNYRKMAVPQYDLRQAFWFEELLKGRNHHFS